MSPPGPGLDYSAVLDRWFAAANAHDIDAQCELATPDVEIVTIPEMAHGPAGATYRGREGLRTLLETGLERFPRLRIDFTPVDETAEQVRADLLFVLDDGSSTPALRPAAGEYWICPATGLIARVQLYEPGWQDHDPSALLPREREVLSLLAAGWRFPEISQELGLSRLTVRLLARSANRRLHARTTSHAIAIAIERGELTVVEPEP